MRLAWSGRQNTELLSEYLERESPRIIIGAHTPDKPDKITSSCENIFSKESIVLTHIVGEQPY